MKRNRDSQKLSDNIKKHNAETSINTVEYAKCMKCECKDGSVMNRPIPKIPGSYGNYCTDCWKDMF